MISYSPAEYDGKTIPAWAEFLGWLMVLLPILCVLGRALKILLYRRVPVSNSFMSDKIGHEMSFQAVSWYLACNVCYREGLENIVIQKNTCK